MTALHFIPNPQLDESPRSILSRAAASNGFQSVEKFARAFNREINIKPLEWQLKNSSLAVRLDQLNTSNNLRNSFYNISSKVTRGGPITINEVLLPQEMLRTRAHVYCPLCICEGWGKYIQDIALVDDCPYHDCRYETHCPSCTQAVSWTANNGVYCRCGFDLSTTLPTKTDATFAKNILALISDKQQAAVDTFLQVLKSLRFRAGLSNDQKAETLTLAMDITTNVEGSVERAMQNHISRYAEAPVELFATPWLSVENQRIAAEAESAISNLSKTLHAPDVYASEEPWFYKTELEQLGISSRKLVILTQEGLIEKRRVKIKTPFHYVSNDWFAVLRWLRESGTSTAHSNLHDETRCDVETAAQILDVYPEAVRRAVKAGFMEKGLTFQGRRMFILKSEVSLFQNTHTFVGPLAKSLKTPNTTLTARLASVGILPVSGPTVDSGLVSIYEKSDLDEKKIQKSLAMEHYSNNSGRKKEQLAENPDYISATNTAHILGFEIQRLKYLKTQGLLTEETPPEYRGQNKRYFTRKSVFATKAILDDAISLENACTALEIAGPTFARRFIKSNFIQPLIFGKRQFIRREDYDRIQENLKSYCSCDQLDKYLGAPPRHSTNLVTTGRLSIATIDETKIDTIRLISWKEVHRKFSPNQ